MIFKLTCSGIAVDLHKPQKGKKTQRIRGYDKGLNLNGSKHSSVNPNRIILE